MKNLITVSQFAGATLIAFMSASSFQVSTNSIALGLENANAEANGEGGSSGGGFGADGAAGNDPSGAGVGGGTGPGGSSGSPGTSNGGVGGTHGGSNYGGGGGLANGGASYGFGITSGFGTPLGIAAGFGPPAGTPATFFAGFSQTQNRPGIYAIYDLTNPGRTPTMVPSLNPVLEAWIDHEHSLSKGIGGHISLGYVGPK